ncbi:ceramidase [Xylogone sp. PMI_703]|nr:ceramidase [Xylogone sp. PMI_703]
MAGLLSWPYRKHAHSPYWGEINSEYNFCEEDYIITEYIAEVVNTFTNIVYCYYAYRGMKLNSNRPDAFMRNLSYLGLATVGFGSIIYHATLKYYTQWFDDLSMLIATGLVMHRVYTYDKSLKYTVVYGVVLSTIISAFIAWHCIMDETTGHSIFFAIMMLTVSRKTRRMMAEKIEDKKILGQLRDMAFWGTVIFVAGFAIWLVDNGYCDQLTSTKRAIGMPWSFILEFHGWWHILTGIGGYVLIAVVEYVTSEDAGKPLGSSFAWPVGLIIEGSDLDAKPSGEKKRS